MHTVITSSSMVITSLRESRDVIWIRGNAMLVIDAITPLPKKVIITPKDH